MKKVIIFLFLVFFVSSTANAGFISNMFGGSEDEKKSDSTATDGANQNAGENRGVIGSGIQVINELSGNGEGANKKKKPRESVVTLTMDANLYLMPDQVAKNQQQTGAYSLGVTYKFSEYVHLWAKYLKAGVDGIKFDDEETTTDYQYEYMLAGAGLRWFVFNGSNQVQLDVGSGYAKVTSTNNGSEPQKMKFLKNPLFVGLKFLWAWDNVAFGPFYSIIDVESSAKTRSEYQKGGMKIFGLTAQFGLPSL